MKRPIFVLVLAAAFSLNIGVWSNPVNTTSPSSTQSNATDSTPIPQLYWNYSQVYESAVPPSYHRNMARTFDNLTLTSPLSAWNPLTGAQKESFFGKLFTWMTHNHRRLSAIKSEEKRTTLPPIELANRTFTIAYVPLKN